MPTCGPTHLQFRAALRAALASTPAPLTEEESHALSWAGGTERFLGAVGEASRLAAPPRLGDNAARFAHLWLLGSGFTGYLGDAVRTFVFESGPVSRQRWLTRERRYRTSTSVTEVVAKSVAVTPAQRDEHWEQRYENKTSSWNLTRALLRAEQLLPAFARRNGSGISFPAFGRNGTGISFPAFARRNGTGISFPTFARRKK